MIVKHYHPPLSSNSHHLETNIMKLNSAMLYIIDGLKQCDNWASAKKYLVSKKFICIGAGCESIVFSRPGFEYVIKIQYSPFRSSGTFSEIPSVKHFLEFYLERGEDFNIIIQPKIQKLDFDNYGESLRKFRKFSSWVENKFKVSDVHGGNVGSYRGKMMVFDWTVA